MNKLLTFTSAVGAIGASMFVTGIVETTRFCLRQVQVPVLPKGTKPVTVLHISDIHLLPGQKRKRRWLRQLASHNPDLVVNTGDNISSAGAIEALLDDLGPLLARPGFFVFGSNDYYHPQLKNPFKYLINKGPKGKPTNQKLPVEELRAGFISAGWVELNNACATVQIGDLLIEACGTDDAHIGLANYPKNTMSVSKKTSLNQETGLIENQLGLNSDSSSVGNKQLKIGVTHAPYLSVLNEMVSDGVELIFAGHTHGGQVCLPSGRAIITNCDLDVERAKGLSVHSFNSRQSFLHVSGGIGGSPFVPVRFFNRPEATLVKLIAG